MSGNRLKRCCGIAMVLLLSSCAYLQPDAPPAPATESAPQPPTVHAAQPATLAPDAAVTQPTPASVFRGTGVFVHPPATVAGPARLSSEGEVTLNFANADVREVARAVLGDALHLNYV